MNNAVATISGYTLEILCECGGNALSLLTKPGEDYDSYFKAWDVDAEEFIYVEGWQCSIEIVQ